MSPIRNTSYSIDFFDMLIKFVSYLRTPLFTRVEWFLLGVKESLGHAQIGGLQGINSNLPSSFLFIFIWESFASLPLSLGIYPTPAYKCCSVLRSSRQQRLARLILVLFYPVRMEAKLLSAPNLRNTERHLVYSGAYLC